MPSPSPTHLADRYAFLQEELARLEHAYYVLDAPLLPDIEYDRLYREMLEIEVCLLYTSPSPRDRQKSRMPSSA